MSEQPAHPSLEDADFLKSQALRDVFSALGDDPDVVRLVGGAIRNTLMGLPVSDLDLATSLLPEDVIKRAEARGIRAIPTGLAHGTVTLVVDHRPYEVTTLRRDVETDGRHATVSFTDDWTEDARRRDFTINALYADAEGRIYDPVGGLPDIADRQIRFIGRPDDRIEEDYLRILRFFRFFAYYGDGRPDAEGLKACARLKDGLDRLSAERVWSEMKRLLAAQDPGRALLWMRTVGVLQKVLPESWGIDALPAYLDLERELRLPPDALGRLEAMLPPEIEKIDHLAKRLKLSAAEAKRLAGWAGCPTISSAALGAELGQLFYAHGVQPVCDSLMVVRARAVSSDPAAEPQHLAEQFATATAWVRPIFPVQGKDLIAAGMSPGPGMGERLQHLEEVWIASNFSLSRDDLLQR